MPALDEAAATERAGITAKRRDTGELSDFPSREPTEFRGISEQGPRQDRPDTWDTPTEIVLCTPDGRLPNRRVEFRIRPVQFAREIRDVRGQALPHVFLT